VLQFFILGKKLGFFYQASQDTEYSYFQPNDSPQNISRNKID
jgi:hypothetical protein